MKLFIKIPKFKSSLAFMISLNVVIMTIENYLDLLFNIILARFDVSKVMEIDNEYI